MLCLTALGATISYIDARIRKYPKESYTFYLQELWTLFQGQMLEPWPLTSQLLAGISWLLFLYKCIYGIIVINLDNSAQFCSGCSHWGSSGLFLNNKTAKTSLFHDSFFIRITNLWNALPIAIRSEVKFLLRKS